MTWTIPSPGKKPGITAADIAQAIMVIVTILAFAAGIVMIFVGIWSDWRWALTGMVTAFISFVVAYILSEL